MNIVAVSLPLSFCDITMSRFPELCVCVSTLAANQSKQTLKGWTVLTEKSYRLFNSLSTKQFCLVKHPALCLQSSKQQIPALVAGVGCHNCLAISGKTPDKKPWARTPSVLLKHSECVLGKREKNLWDFANVCYGDGFFFIFKSLWGPDWNPFAPLKGNKVEPGERPGRLPGRQIELPWLPDLL